VDETGAWRASRKAEAKEQPWLHRDPQIARPVRYSFFVRFSAHLASHIRLNANDAN
jgi:hypothetical protein